MPFPAGKSSVLRCRGRVKALQNLPWLPVLNYLKPVTSGMAQTDALAWQRLQGNAAGKGEPQPCPARAPAPAGSPWRVGIIHHPPGSPSVRLRDASSANGARLLICCVNNDVLLLWLKPRLVWGCHPDRAGSPGERAFLSSAPAFSPCSERSAPSLMGKL